MKKIQLLSLLICTLVSANARSQVTQQWIEDHRRHSTNRMIDAELHYPKQVENYDVTFYGLDLSADNRSVYLEGSGTIKASSTIELLDTIIVQLVSDYTIDSVFFNGEKHTFDHENDLVTLLLTEDETVPLGEFFELKINYHGELSNARQNYPDGIVHDAGRQVVYTITEPIFAHYWFPVKQQLTDKADSADIFITTPSNLKVGSNGLLTTVALENDRTRHEWRTRYPIAYYLISLGIGDFTEYRQTVELPGREEPMLVQNYVYSQSYLSQNKDRIDEVLPMLQLYSELFGVYPFADEKYGHCTVPMGGGMEHQTMSSMGGYGYTLVAHELAHQWFGDEVTCRTWQDIWINEGFASYSEILALEKLVSVNTAKSEMQSYHNYVFQTANHSSVFIPSAELDVDFDNLYQTHVTFNYRVFDYALTYIKGAAFLHTLRGVSNNDDLFFAACRKFLETFKDGSASGDDFAAILATETGKDFSPVFDDWYYGRGYPTYEVLYEHQSDTLYVQVDQRTSTSYTSYFNSPLEINVIRESLNDSLVWIYPQQGELLQYVVPGTVTNLVIDPNNWLVNKADPPQQADLVNDPKGECEDLNQNDICDSEECEDLNQNGICDSEEPVLGNPENFPLPIAAKLFPNPAKEQLNLHFEQAGNSRTLTLTDLVGKQIWQKEVQLQKVEVPVKTLPPGVYLLSVQADGAKATTRFVKK